MALALTEAKRGWGFVAPNPPVGCVILDRNQRLIGSGFHKVYGGPHAEIEALRSVENPKDLIGASVFVTLEPCAHFGKTPPCASELTQHPIARVVIGARDPNPIAANGASILKQRGIEVQFLTEFQQKCEQVAEVFFFNQKFKLPFVHLKVATSLDGQMALATGESQWITGEASRAYVQQLRGQTDTVLIGLTTYLKDNPRLNSRAPEFQANTNRVIILDPSGESLSSLTSSSLAKVRGLEKLVVVVGSEAVVQNSNGPQVIVADLEGQEFRLSDVLQKLYQIGINSLLLEGGAYTISSFLRQQKVQRLSLMMAPTIIGSGNGLSWSKHFSVSKLNEQLHLETLEVNQFGADVCLSARFKTNS
jgi:diaminohydroxyphosphoribosylaminopyrimidine deaminase/5-amino-6-(5-phosphoribosylamino)uracil reductase